MAVRNITGSAAHFSSNDVLSRSSFCTSGKLLAVLENRWASSPKSSLFLPPNSLSGSLLSATPLTDRCVLRDGVETCLVALGGGTFVSLGLTAAPVPSVSSDVGLTTGRDSVPISHGRRRFPCPHAILEIVQGNQPASDLVTHNYGMDVLATV